MVVIYKKSGDFFAFFCACGYNLNNMCNGGDGSIYNDKNPLNPPYKGGLNV